MIALAVVLSLAVASADSPSNQDRSAATPARLELDASTFDWGERVQGERIEHAFTITNRGERPLRIQKIRGAVGAQATRFPRLLRPGESGKIEVLVRSELLPLRDDRTAKRILRIFCNDPNANSTPIELSGRLVTALELPSPAVALRLNHGRPTPGKLRVRAARSDDRALATLLDVVPENPATTQVDDVRALGGDEWEIAFTALPSRQAGRRVVRMLAHLTLRDGNAATVPIPIEVEQEAPFLVHPTDRVHFGAKQTGSLRLPNATPLVQSIDLIARPGEEFHITKVERTNLPPHAFAVELRMLEFRKAYRITVRLRKALNTRSIRGSVLLHTDQPWAAQVRVAVGATFVVPTGK